MSYRLDFSQKSLIEEIDKILDCEVGIEPIHPESWELASMMAIYIGETLCRIYDGIWQGAFTNKADDYYTSWLMFGEYKFAPTHFIQYRISNGKESEGTFKEYFEIVKPEIIARKSNFNK